MQRDVMKMDSISKQAILLAKNNISSEEDLINLYKNLKNELYKDPNREDIKSEIKLISEIRNRLELVDRQEKENKKEVVR